MQTLACPTGWRVLLGCLLAGSLGMLGCQRAQPPLAPTKPTEVIVDRPIVRDVRDFEDFTGRTEAIASVDIRSRVTGYLDKILFKDGTDVPRGTPLFEIDPRTYAATLEQTKASAAQAKAHLERTTRDYRRVTGVGTSAITQEEIDRVTGDKNEAEAQYAATEAARKLAQTNLDYTKIAAPIAGRLSRRMIDPGNLVKADDTTMVTIVALDPIYATFDIDERTLLKIRRLVREGKMDSARSTEMTVQIGLADEETYSQAGVVDFIDNRVDANTGTLRVRATLPNPKLLLSPGLFIRVRIPVGRMRPGILIPEEALGSDQGNKFVFVVNDQDEVVYRRVRLGQQVDQFRVVEEGLTIDDRVIVKGLQRVRAGVKVAPKQAEPAKKKDPAGTVPKQDVAAGK